jgi:hypothetical protein
MVGSPDESNGNDPPRSRDPFTITDAHSHYLIRCHMVSKEMGWVSYSCKGRESLWNCENPLDGK